MKELMTREIPRRYNAYCQFEANAVPDGEKYQLDCDSRKSAKPKEHVFEKLSLAESKSIQRPTCNAPKGTIEWAYCILLRAGRLGEIRKSPEKAKSDVDTL